MSYFNSKSI